MSARATSRTAADRARLLDAGSAQEVRGHHPDGWNVVHVDGHVSSRKRT